MQREDHIVYLLLGSNLGNREAFLDLAARKIGEKIGRVVEQSCIYETPPWGFKAETNFLNRVIRITTGLSPEGLLAGTKAIENELGRERTGEDYQSRTLDIDILFYDEGIFKSEDLQIPHKKMEERRFVLVPLEEIAPGFIHPVSGRTVREMLDACPDKGWIKKVKDLKSPYEHGI